MAERTPPKEGSSFNQPGTPIASPRSHGSSSDSSHDPQESQAGSSYFQPRISSGSPRSQGSSPDSPYSPRRETLTTAERSQLRFGPDSPHALQISQERLTMADRSPLRAGPSFSQPGTSGASPRSLGSSPDSPYSPRRETLTTAERSPLRFGPSVFHSGSLNASPRSQGSSPDSPHAPRTSDRSPTKGGFSFFKRSTLNASTRSQGSSSDSDVPPGGGEDSPSLLDSPRSRTNSVDLELYRRRLASETDVIKSHIVLRITDFKKSFEEEPEGAYCIADPPQPFPRAHVLNENENKSLKDDLTRHVSNQNYIWDAINEVTSGKWPALANFLYNREYLLGYFLHRLDKGTTGIYQAPSKKKMHAVFTQWTKILPDVYQAVGE